MKKILALPALLLLNLAAFAQVLNQGKPAFVVTYEENGKNWDGSWKYSATVKFSLSASNGWFYVNESGIPDFKKLSDFDPARFLKLEPGSVIGFYPSEVDESGGSPDGAHYTRVLTPDGTETVVETYPDETRTIITTEADVRRRFGMPTDGSAYNLNARSYQIAGQMAELERTETGAILRAYTSVGNNLGEWSVSQETMEQVFPKVETFMLTDEDIKSWQQISRTNVASGSGEDEELSVKLSVKMEVPDLERPEVTLEGCSEMGIGELEIVTATGKPEGGTYRFWCEPEDLLTIQSDGSSSVVITGAGPGRGTLSVEYTGPGGNTVQASQQAICVKIDNYNGGEPIPQIALFDIDGKKLPGIIKVPVAGEPSRIEELVDFITADNSILTANWLENSVELHGMRQGKTNLQAKTSCGKTTGPTVEVEVVNCDKETVEALEKMRKGAVENLQDAAQRLQKTAGSKEFEKARDDLVLATLELLGKAGMTIVTSGTAVSETGVPSAVVNTASKIAEAAAAVSDMISSGSLEEFYTNAGKAASGELFDKAVYTHFGDKIADAWGKSLSSIIGVVDVYQAAKRFGDIAGELLKHGQVVESEMESWKKADSDFKRIEKLQQICKGDKTEPKKPEEPKKEPTPEPAKPIPPKEPKPKTDPPPANEQPTPEPTPPQPGDQEPPVPPTPPTSETRQVGLPYSPEECGCGKSKSIAVNSAGFSTLQSGIKNLSDCVEKFSLSVDDYSKALGEIATVTDTLKTALAENPAIFRVKAEKAKPQLDSLVTRVRSYETAGQTFLKQFDKCPESVSAGMDVLKSAMTVTVDSITTKY